MGASRRLIPPPHSRPRREGGDSRKQESTVGVTGAGRTASGIPTEHVPLSQAVLS